MREDLGELFKKMNDSRYQWMRDRITRLWPDWKLAAKQLEKEKSTFKNRRVKNVSLKTWVNQALFTALREIG